MADHELKQIIVAISDLSRADQERLYLALAPWLNEVQLRTQTSSSLDEVREARFAKGLVCPRCGGEKVRRHGKFRDKSGPLKQRYMCRDCARTFSDLTGTPLAHSKMQSKWGKFIGCMVEGLSVRKAAARLEVNPKTTFRWRHKVLNAMRQLMKPTLEGVVESDETYFRQSFKGQPRLRAQAGRNARMRGEPAAKRGLSREQVCVLVARDRQKQTIAEPSCMGSPSVAAVQKVLAPLVASGSVLCTDGGIHYRRFCLASRLEHWGVSARKRTQGSIYHIRNVNAYHSRLKGWNKRFKGVSTKYLPNYLTWHLYVDRTGKMSPGASRKQMLLEACSAIFVRPSAA